MVPILKLQYSFMARYAAIKLALYPIHLYIMLLPPTGLACTLNVLQVGSLLPSLLFLRIFFKRCLQEYQRIEETSLKICKAN